MTPLPKRRHSYSRGKKRESVTMSRTLPNAGTCKTCGHLKRSHRTCSSCGSYT